MRIDDVQHLTGTTDHPLRLDTSFPDFVLGARAARAAAGIPSVDGGPPAPTEVPESGHRHAGSRTAQSTAPPQARHTLGAGSRRTRREESPRLDGEPWASPLSLDDRLEHLVVQRQIGHEHLQAAVLVSIDRNFFASPTSMPPYFCSPAVERVLADPVLPAEISSRRPRSARASSSTPRAES